METWFDLDFMTEDWIPLFLTRLAICQTIKSLVVDFWSRSLLKDERCCLSISQTFPGACRPQIHQSAPAHGARKTPSWGRWINAVTPRMSRHRRGDWGTRGCSIGAQSSGSGGGVVVEGLSSPLPFSHIWVPRHLANTSRRARRGAPGDWESTFWVVDTLLSDEWKVLGGWRGANRGQCDCSYETKGSLSPGLQYISVDNATALRTRGKTRARRLCPASAKQKL